MSTAQSQKNGFTLIELLVVISIVAVISAIGLVSYQGVQTKARDSARKNDLNNLALALELYFQKNSSYIKDVNSCQTDPATSILYTQIKNYMQNQSVPADPITRLAYCYISENNGQGYRLFAKLGNCADPANPICSYNWNYSLVSDNLTIAAAPGDNLASANNTSSGVSASKPFSCENYGDLNNDRKISAADVQIIRDSIASGTQFSEDQRTLADVDSDFSNSGVTQEDADFIQRYLDGQDAQLPVCQTQFVKTPPCEQYGDVTTDGKVTMMDSAEAARLGNNYTNSVYTKAAYTEDQKKYANVADPATTLTNASDSFAISLYVNGTFRSFHTCPKDPPCGQYGDVDLDGKVTDTDRKLIRDHVNFTGGFQLSADQLERADVDNDGDADSGDRLRIGHYLTGSTAVTAFDVTTFSAVCQ